MLAAVSYDYVEGKKRLRFLKRSDDGTYHVPDLDAKVKDKSLMFVPCGQCKECRAQHARTWANRLLLELQYHSTAYFVTLTYDDNNIKRTISRDGAPHFTLDKKHCQDFMKRLRKHFPDQKIRYFLAGEYGEITHRPHYHAIIFGLELSDLELVGMNEYGQPHFNSPELASIWKHGYITVAEVCWESCCYVARYCMKKLKGDARFLYEDLNIVPPFVLMSRKPGIGSQWFYDHPEFINYDQIHVATPNGRRSFRPPRYYEKLIADSDPDLAEYRAAQRQKAAVISFDNTTNNTSLDYLTQLEVVAEANDYDYVRKF